MYSKKSKNFRQPRFYSGEYRLGMIVKYHFLTQEGGRRAVEFLCIRGKLKFESQPRRIPYFLGLSASPPSSRAGDLYRFGKERREESKRWRKGGGSGENGIREQFPSSLLSYVQRGGKKTCVRTHIFFLTRIPLSTQGNLDFHTPKMYVEYRFLCPQRPK